MTTYGIGKLQRVEGQSVYQPELPGHYNAYVFQEIYGTHTSVIDAKRALVEAMEPDYIGQSNRAIQRGANQWFNVLKHFKVLKL